MYRIILSNLAVLAIVMLSAASSQAQKGLSARDAGKLVDEYIELAGDGQRAAAIVGELSGQGLLCQRSLKSALRKDSERPAALKLAIALRVPGLFDTAKRYIDGDDEQAVIELGLVSGDKGAGKELVELWAAAEPDSARCTWIRDGLLKHPVDLDAIQELKKLLAGEGARATDAGKALKVQLGAETDEPAALLADWDKLVAAWRLDAQAFTLKGADLLAFPTCAVTGEATRVGPNYRLKGEGKITIDLPEEWNTGDFTVTLRVRAVEGELQRAGLHVGQGVWLVVHRTGEWSVTAGSAARFTADYKLGEWVELKWVVRDQSAGAAKMVRMSDVFVGPKKLVPAGRTNGEVQKVEIHAHGGSMVVGGCEISR